ncbi:isoaspartyl peptidase/L-asparaginase [bacterium]|nr:isoaspartyl peptidase/L-asparaginase [bacterium]
MSKATIIVHGGAGWIQDHVWPAYQAGTQAAARAGQAVLDAGGTALDSVVAAILELENNETFNAGYGSSLNADGVVENDCFLMRSEDLRSGAAACLIGVRNPILVARAVLEQTPHELLAGAGAIAFAKRIGLPLCGPDELASPRRRAQWQQLKDSGESFETSIFLESKAEPPQASQSTYRPGGRGQDGGSGSGRGGASDLDSSTLAGGVEPTPQQGDTVGACAIDSAGRIAVGSSTGGIMMKMPGRVGDSPIIGAGSYAGPAGAVTATGHGEAAMRVLLAKFVYDRMAEGQDALSAARAGVAEMVSKVDGKAGVIVLDAQGRRAWCTSTSRIASGVPEQLLDSADGSL